MSVPFKKVTAVWAPGLILLTIAVAGLSGCTAPGSDHNDDGRVQSLQSELEKTRADLAAEQSKLSEAEKHRLRMIGCHRDFQGSYGKLIEEKVTLTRVTGRVIRKNCAGAIVSDQKETLEPAIKVIELQELKDLSATGARVIVNNRQTCGAGGLSTGWTRFSTPTLTVNRSNTLLDHEVFEGLNQIDFGLCDEKGTEEGISKKCDAPTWVGTLNLDVVSLETEKNEITEINAQCGPVAAKP